MQVLIKWIITALLDYTLGLAVKLYSYFANKLARRKASEAKDKVLETSDDALEREKTHEDILNP